jgi:hypothetical protein
MNAGVAADSIFNKQRRTNFFQASSKILKVGCPRIRMGLIAVSLSSDLWGWDMLEKRRACSGFIAVLFLVLQVNLDDAPGVDWVRWHPSTGINGIGGKILYNKNDVYRDGAICFQWSHKKIAQE